MVRYGAKSLPYGGWLTMPKLAGKGWMILGDSASLLNSQRLKGIHLAIKSGMLAAETAFESMRVGDNSSRLSAPTRAGRRQLDQGGAIPGAQLPPGFRARVVARPAAQRHTTVAGWRNIGPDLKNRAGYRNLRQLDAIGRSTYGREATLGPAKSDGKLTFDKLTDVYHSGTRHEDDQPVHLVIRDMDICNHRCVQEYGNPCQNFCPAAVYEMVERSEPAGSRSTSTSPTACIARPATSWTPTKSSPGCLPREAAVRTTRVCDRPWREMSSVNETSDLLAVRAGEMGVVLFYAQVQHGDGLEVHDVLIAMILQTYPSLAMTPTSSIVKWKSLGRHWLAFGVVR